MEHPIEIPILSKVNLALEINSRLRKLNFERFGNEPNYTPALISKLQDFRYEDSQLLVEMDGAVMTSVGRDTAEKWSGADFSVITTITYNGERVSKANLFQTKRGRVDNLNNNEKIRLINQVGDMKQIINCPKVLEIYEDNSLPTVISANGLLVGRKLQRITFGKWIANRVLPTFDGTKNDFTINSLLQADLSNLKVKVRLKDNPQEKIPPRPSQGRIEKPKFQNREEIREIIPIYKTK